MADEQHDDDSQEKNPAQGDEAARRAGKVEDDVEDGVVEKPD